jgi:DNA-binding winged helix-turn-helix (wHTH) protein/TolB-like protein/Tfp pilus assembly protein PilF
MGSQIGPLYAFGPFRVDPVERVLWQNGRVVPLAPKVFETLLVLVENSGHLVEKEQLMQRVWPDTFVEQGNLTLNISTLRKLLGESSKEHHYIETIPRRGYRFVAYVRDSSDESVDLVMEEHTRSRIISDEKEETDTQDASEPGVDEVLMTRRGSDRRANWRPSSISFVIPLILLGVALIASYFWISNKTNRTEGLKVRSIAVLPFKPLGPDDTDEYLGVGMADALITQLSNIKQIVVRPTSFVLKYSRSGQDPKIAGRELGVDSLLDGKIQKVNDRIRVTVQLISTQDGSSLWADKFDEQLTNIFSVQDSISEQVAAMLMLKLTGEDRKLLAKRYTQNSEAYQSYLRGRYHWNKRTTEGLKAGVDYFKQAIEGDPQYALAYAGLADSYNMLAAYGLVPPKESFPQAKEAAWRALKIDDTLVEARTSLAYCLMYHDWQWSDAEREFKLAIKVNPNYALAHHWYAFYLRAMRRHDEAIVGIKRSVELDPLSLIISAGAGWIFSSAGRYDEAIEFCLKTLELDPSFVMGHVRLGYAYQQKSRFEEAILEFQKAVTLTRGRPRMLAQLARAYALAGKRSQAQMFLNEAKEQLKRSYDTPYFIALAHAALGEDDEAFEWLEKSYEERSHLLVDLNVESTLDRLRSDRRFQDLVKRVGLPQL